MTIWVKLKLVIKDKMFSIISKTWNPVTGCYHFCKYCWARRFVERRLKSIYTKYREGFKIKIHPHEFRKKLSYENCS